MKAYHRVPDISLSHLKTLTDEKGIIQHAKYSVPDLSHGYCVDDNARALILACMIMGLEPSAEVLDLISTYLRFMEFVQRDDGAFHNFVDKDFNVLDSVGSEDSIGRSLWAAGYMSAFPYLSPNLTRRGRDLFVKASHHADDLISPRAISFAISGLGYYLRSNPYDLAAQMQLERLALSLVESFENYASEDWHWFEESLTYCNARLVQALYVAYMVTGRWRFLEVAEKALGWLGTVMMRDDIMYVVGNNGWYHRFGSIALYDQQPVDAAAMVDLYITAFLATGRYVYYSAAFAAFGWFLGYNSRGLAVYDPLTGGCFDALTEDGVNLNRGAESTISYLMARIAIEFLAQPVHSRKDLLLYL